MCNISTILDSFFNSYSPSLSVGLRDNRLERMSLLLDKLGNPEKKLKMIHIAGSKGKGTTASFMAWIMNKMGLKTGLYLSPHVFDIRERFTLGTVFFPDSLYSDTLSLLKEKLEGFSIPSSLGPNKPTTFELYTAYAYLLFYNAGCEYGVIETGLGGRLDATNTILPIATCFTYIEKEHTKILGETLEEIATEKAGIMRKGVPSFMMDMPSRALNTLINYANNIGSPYSVFPLHLNNILYKDKGIENKVEITIGNKSISIVSSKGFTDILFFDLSYALFVLSSINIFTINENVVLNLENEFNLPGRFQIEDYKERHFLLDGAHTPTSISHLIDNIEVFRYSPLSTLIFSSAIDKNYIEMADLIVDKFDTIIITSLGENKKSDPEAIYEYISKKWREKRVILSPTPLFAVQYAIQSSPKDGYILVTGSFYLVDLIHKEIKDKE